MRNRVQRKTNPRVIDGRVQKKNNDIPTHNYYHDSEAQLVIDRRRPGPGARHILKVEDIRKFIEIVPNWAEQSKGIDAVALLPLDEDTFGLYNYAGVIKLNAWPSELHQEFWPETFNRKKWLIEALGVEQEQLPWATLCKFTENQVKGFQLLGTFLHELGHHIDRMNCKGKHDCPGGEPFAIQFEQDMQRKIWPEFVKRFPLP